MKLIVCTMQRHAPNPHSCGNGGALEVVAKLERELTEAELFVTLERIGCFGACLKGPNVQLLPEGKIWHEVDIEMVKEIIVHIKHMTSKNKFISEK